MLSGGNVQRCVLARELDGEVRLLIVANPCFGLDVKAVAEVRARIMAARNAGAAVLLVSEDLDEILELADRIVVMHGGKVVHETAGPGADAQSIGAPYARLALTIRSGSVVDVYRPNRQDTLTPPRSGRTSVDWIVASGPCPPGRPLSGERPVKDNGSHGRGPGCLPPDHRDHPRPWGDP